MVKVEVADLLRCWLWLLICERQKLNRGDPKQQKTAQEHTKAASGASLKQAKSADRHGNYDKSSKLEKKVKTKNHLFFKFEQMCPNHHACRQETMAAGTPQTGPHPRNPPRIGVELIGIRIFFM